MAYERKTRDEWQVQTNYGYGHGFEETTAHDSYRGARAELRVYRENQPEFAHRLKCVRVKKES